MNTAQRTASTAKRRRWAADPMAMWRIVGRKQPFTAEESMSLALPVRIAYERIRTGATVDGDFDTLAAAVNVAMICAERIDGLVEQACIAARDALMRMHERHKRTGRWGFDGPGLQEVLGGIEVYEQLTQLLTAGQLEDALRECMRRAKAGEVMQ